MTQNPYPGPPPGWAPPPPQGYAYPGGQPDPQYQQAPPPPPGYGQPPAQQWPPPAGVPQGVPEPGAPAAGDYPFSNPGVPQAPTGDQPGVHQLEGRLLLIRPTSYDPSAPPHPSAVNGKPGPLVMAEMIICDGPPIPGNVNGDTGVMTPFAAGPKQTPFYCGSMYVRGAVLPGQLEPFVGSRGQVLGRLVKGQPGRSGKPPWVLADPTDADRVIGRQMHDAWAQIKAAGQPPRPDQFAAPAQQAQQWPGVQQTPQAYPPAGLQPQYGPRPGQYPQQAPPPPWAHQGQPQGYPPPSY